MSLFLKEDLQMYKVVLQNIIIMQSPWRLFLWRNPTWTKSSVQLKEYYDLLLSLACGFGDEGKWSVEAHVLKSGGNWLDRILTLPRLLAPSSSPACQPDEGRWPSPWLASFGHRASLCSKCPTSPAPSGLSLSLTLGLCRCQAEALRLPSPAASTMMFSSMPS